MATLEECRAALEIVVARLATADDAVRRRHLADRTISCRVRDLDVTFTGRLANGRLADVTTERAPKAQIRLTVGSDDLLALTNGHLSFASAWARGRVKVDASVMDLLRLRNLL
ncbi:MAG TPA: SCP2 sterol-binding domain-containing protein [Mycobacteriales bacterium]|nr:SCP2 sterol-binding domain-containing protein [Mycobacteriales bacterium]